MFRAFVRAYIYPADVQQCIDYVGSCCYIA